MNSDAVESERPVRPRGRLAGHNRLRLVVFGFLLCFLAIGGRLAQLTLLPPPPPDQPLRVEDRIPRPDIVDRNGVVLATDISVPSLFADPRKIIDVDEAVELLTARFPISMRDELAREADPEPGLRVAQARGESGRARSRPRSRHSGHRLPQRDPARLSDGAACRACAGLCRSRFPRASPASRNISTTRARSTPPRSPIRSATGDAGDAVDRYPRAACAGRRARQGDHEVPRHGRGAAWCSMSTPARWSASSRCPTSIRTLPKRRAGQGAHEPHDQRRVRARLGRQGGHLRDGASTMASPLSTAATMRAFRWSSAGRASTISTPRGGS